MKITSYVLSSLLLASMTTLGLAATNTVNTTVKPALTDATANASNAAAATNAATNGSSDQSGSRTIR